MPEELAAVAFLLPLDDGVAGGVAAVLVPIFPRPAAAPVDLLVAAAFVGLVVPPGLMAGDFPAALVGLISPGFVFPAFAVLAEMLLPLSAADSPLTGLPLVAVDEGGVALAGVLEDEAATVAAWGLAAPLNTLTAAGCLGVVIFTAPATCVSVALALTLPFVTLTLTVVALPTNVAAAAASFPSGLNAESGAVGFEPASTFTLVGAAGVVLLTAPAAAGVIFVACDAFTGALFAGVVSLMAAMLTVGLAPTVAVVAAVDIVGLIGAILSLSGAATWATVGGALPLEAALETVEFPLAPAPATVGPGATETKVAVATPAGDGFLT